MSVFLIVALSHSDRIPHITPFQTMEIQLIVPFLQPCSQDASVVWPVLLVLLAMGSMSVYKSCQAAQACPHSQNTGHACKEWRAGTKEWQCADLDCAALTGMRQQEVGGLSD